MTPLTLIHTISKKFFGYIITYENVKYGLTTKFDSEERFTLDSVLESGGSIIKRELIVQK